MGEPHVDLSKPMPVIESYASLASTVRDGFSLPNGCSCLQVLLVAAFVGAVLGPSFAA